MGKKPYSDSRWHDYPPLSNLGEPDWGLSEEEKAKRRKFLDEIHVHFLGKHIQESEIPDNLKANN
ncbi:hypothetical protein [Paucilactobacillus sp. N302-9]